MELEEIVKKAASKISTKKRECIIGGTVLTLISLGFDYKIFKHATQGDFLSAGLTYIASYPIGFGGKALLVTGGLGYVKELKPFKKVSNIISNFYQKFNENKSSA